MIGLGAPWNVYGRGSEWRMCKGRILKGEAVQRVEDWRTSRGDDGEMVQR